MVFRAGSGAPKAVPLSLVARLEDIDRRSIELSDGQPVVQYRGRLMPLVPFDPAFQLTTEGKQPVLVFADENDRSMGIMVDEIVDIVEDQVRVQLAGERPGLMGSAIIAGKATDVIDVGYYITQAFGDFFGSTEAFEEENDGKRVLLVDDSPFFRNLLTPLLTVAGYHVRAMENAAEALEARDAGERFDIIVSDIEMPGMSGFEFAEQVKADERWSDTPVVALSSHATPRDIDRGRQAGFTDYVAKFDRDALLRSLAQTLSQTKGAA
jgi:two-component system chemotaxis sensor kinase CheA